MTLIGKISDLAPQKKSSRRYSVSVDGKFVVGADQEVIAKLRLREGQPLTTQQVAEIEFADELLQATRQAMRLLSHRARSRQEMVRALRQKQHRPEVIAAALEHLEQAGLLNDEELALSMVRYLGDQQQRGRRAILDRLRKAGISRELAEKVGAELLDEAGELTRARRTAEKYLQRQTGEAGPRLGHKLYQHLQRRGFDGSLCQQVTQEMLPDFW